MDIFLSEGQVIILGEQDMYAFTTRDEVQEFMEDPMNVHFVGMAARAGVHACMRQLEQLYYTPGTERNELFLLHVLCWRTMIWYIASIPVHEKHLMHKLIALHALILVNGAPYIFDMHGGHTFPVSVPAMYTLEGIACAQIWDIDSKKIATVRYRDPGPSSGGQTMQ